MNWVYRITVHTLTKQVRLPTTSILLKVIETAYITHYYLNMSQDGELLPTAKYSSSDINKEFSVDSTKPLTTNGTTTGPSDYIINLTQGDYTDKNKPTNNKDTKTGRLRAYVTDLQDQVNIFLTERMEIEKKRAKEAKRRLRAEAKTQAVSKDGDSTN